jgi:hypothetical protein
MQDKTYKGSIKCIEAFDDEVSLWHLVGGNGLKLLQQIADTVYLFEKRDRPLSLLLSGRQSAMLYSVCFLRALGMRVSHVQAPMLLHKDGMIEYFTPTDPDKGYIVEDIEYLNPLILPKIIQIIEKGEFAQYDRCDESVKVRPVFGAVLATCKDIKQVNSQITKSVDYVINIEDLTKEQIRQIIKMRLRYANVGYENERVIDMLAAGNSLRMIISVMKIAIIMMLGRSCLKEEDVVTARECL